MKNNKLIIDMLCREVRKLRKDNELLIENYNELRSVASQAQSMCDEEKKAAAFWKAEKEKRDAAFERMHKDIKQREVDKNAMVTEMNNLRRYLNEARGEMAKLRNDLKMAEQTKANDDADMDELLKELKHVRAMQKQANDNAYGFEKAAEKYKEEVNRLKIELQEVRHEAQANADEAAEQAQYAKNLKAELMDMCQKEQERTKGKIQLD